MIKRTCAVCGQGVRSLVQLKQHVEVEHAEADFVGDVREAYIVDAAFAYCGLGRLRCWFWDDGVRVPELVKVFGPNSPHAVYSPGTVQAADEGVVVVVEPFLSVLRRALTPDAA
jgi:hypothetical protein